MTPTRLKKISFPMRVLGGFCLSLCCIFLAIVIPLWPITTPLFLFLALGAPFVFLGYRAKGECPYCYSYIEVTKKRGGTQCKSCKKSLGIKNEMLYPL